MIWWPLSDPKTERERRFAFLLPPLLWAVIAALGPLPMMNRLGWGDEVTAIAALLGMVGGSFGLLRVDWRAPDGHDGWGRVGALWLGFMLLLPGAGAWGLHAESSGAGYVALIAGVIFSALPFGRWETLNAFQCLGFSLRFYGIWLVVMLAVAGLSPDQGGWVLAVAYLLSPPFAAWIRRRLPLRSTLFISNWSTPYPAARRRRFFAILAPLLIVAVYDYASTIGGKTMLHFGGVLEALGVPHFSGIGIVGLLLVQLLPVFILVIWMRDGLSLKALRDSVDLQEYVLMIYVVSNGCAWAAFAVIFQLNKWFFHPWLDDYPRTSLIVIILLTLASGVSFYRLLLGMEVMNPPARRAGKRHDG
ncbi:hypothetical protein [Magnetospirillum sp. 15-1]|uniref:hypothetical protein n=1 Tax=Magnetospirillum sp. 15-1 TaxID=1979370 RepID=UPI000BBBD890|nr:hypothetical protein [Magnetospirillum sp. 15-1]